MCNRTPPIRRCEIAAGGCAILQPSHSPTRPAGWGRTREPDRRVRGRAGSTPRRIAVRRAERRSVRASTGSAASSSRDRTRPRSRSTTVAKTACPKTGPSRTRVRGRNRTRGRSRSRIRARTRRATVRCPGTGPTAGESPPRVGPDGRRMHHSGPFRTVRTGVGECRTTFSAVLPSKTRLSPLFPWVPMTIRSISWASAHSTIRS